MHIQTEVTIDHISNDFTGSLRKQRYVEIDGERHYIGAPQRLAIMPGDFDAARGFIADCVQPMTRAGRNKDGGIMSFLQHYWTDDVVRSFRDALQTPAGEFAEVQAEITEGV